MTQMKHPIHVWIRKVTKKLFIWRAFPLIRGINFKYLASFPSFLGPLLELQQTIPSGEILLPSTLHSSSNTYTYHLLVPSSPLALDKCATPCQHLTRRLKFTSQPPRPAPVSPQISTYRQKNHTNTNVPFSSLSPPLRRPSSTVLPSCSFSFF